MWDKERIDAKKRMDGRGERERQKAICSSKVRMSGFQQQCEIPASVNTVTVANANSSTRGFSVISAVTSRL